jgi:adenylate cyclase
MSTGADSRPPATGSQPSLLSYVRAIQARDMEALNKLRHNLRTPLNQIIGYCEMLLESAEEDGNSAIVRDLKRMHTSGGQLLALINDALAPWKIETGKLDVEGMRREMRTPLNAIIGYAELCLDEAAPGSALGADLERIQKAGQNLYHFIEDDSLERQMPQGGPAGEGTLASKATLGTTSGLTGGLSPIHAAAELISPSESRPPSRLLVVDDDVINREMLGRRLQKLGYAVTEVGDGRSALTILNEGNYDLVLLDIIMPELDGFRVLEFIKTDQRLRHIPVIMLTALDDVESTVRCIEAGAEDFVPKPFNPIVLRARITASLEKKQLRDQEQAFLAQLQSERAKSERLLLNVLPRAVADRLKAGERTIVDSFLECTVLFADIVGFTGIAARSSPSRMVQLLNDLFSSFDRVAEQLALEKIKTIGDAYMLVSGVPVVRPDHAEICIEAAFEFLEALRVFNRRHQLDWQIRLGLHCGPVVAGIIGTRKFAYDLWGDTVNIAARMESHGQPGKIQISGRLKRALEGRFRFEPVGRVDVKNVGPMETFIVHRLTDAPTTA